LLVEGRQNSKIKTWREVTFLENPTTGTKLRIQHHRAHGFLKPMKVTVIGPDLTGLLWPEIKAIGDTFSDFEISMVELAFDFSPESGVDKEFVAKHARFGKSRRVPMPQYPALCATAPERPRKCCVVIGSRKFKRSVWSLSCIRGGSDCPKLTAFYIC
jgi:hypothetical protein